MTDSHHNHSSNTSMANSWPAPAVAAAAAATIHQSSTNSTGLWQTIASARHTIQLPAPCHLPTTPDPAAVAPLCCLHLAHLVRSDGHEPWRVCTISPANHSRPGEGLGDRERGGQGFFFCPEHMEPEETGHEDRSLVPGSSFPLLRPEHLS